MRVVLLILLLPAWAAAAKPKLADPTSLDEYIRAAEERGRAIRTGTPGSLYTPSGMLANVSRDPRAIQVDDLVTVLVADRASALSKANVASARTSSANYSVGALAGPIKAGSKLADLARLSGQQQLKGEGETSRENNLTTTLTARVTHVLPNGAMVIEGQKMVAVNSEMQQVRVRGLIRREDISSGNGIRSDRIAELEIQVNGKGVVADAVRRPFILYRILLGLLPF